jgi:hypothetical protein
MLDIEYFCQQLYADGVTYYDYIKKVEAQYPNDSMSVGYAETYWQTLTKNES